ncbi:precorrin-6A reductase, partial [Candidatus Entotheonella palauensis]
APACTTPPTPIFFAGAAMKPTILLLSGTSEGPVIAQALLEAGFRSIIATVTRDEARAHLFGHLQDDITVLAQGFTAESLPHFLAQHQIGLVLDATHPFAVRITRMAAGVCQQLGTPYVRYERPDWEPPEGTVYVDSYAEAARALPSLGSRMMLTIGAKQLKYFASLHEQLTLFARILPSPVSVQQALDAGFKQAQILALRPPFSRAFNRSLLEEYRADVLVTKASGADGGVVEKVMAAQELGLTTLMIRRPEPHDHQAVSNPTAAVKACCQALLTSE